LAEIYKILVLLLGKLLLAFKAKSYLMEILWLSEEDVMHLLTIDDTIAAVENAFKDQGGAKTQMPPKSYLYFQKYGGDLRSMPAYLEGLDFAGVKIVNVHPGNQESGLPTVMALLVLNSPGQEHRRPSWARPTSPT